MKKTGKGALANTYPARSMRGFTMIELVITIAILSFGIIGVYGVFAPMVRLNAVIASQFTAAQLAQEGFEVARNMRENKVLARCASGCQLDYKTGIAAEGPENVLKTYNESEYLNVTADGFYGYDRGAATKYRRKVTIAEAGSPDILKITVEVFWNEGTALQRFETIGYLYNYQ